MERLLHDQEKPYIVYADDDPDDLEMVDSTLKTIDPLLVTQVYTNGQDAFEFLESIPAGNRLPGLVILDLNMPGWNGLKTMEAIKKNSAYQHIPVIIFTNSDYPPHRESALAGGAADFITKPYNLTDLKEMCVVFANYGNRAPQLK
jgi:CheY-like chemotaxis protein